MAIDPFLFDTYKQYKAGTDKVTTWLANRAREMNTFDDLFPSEAASAKGKGRLKGKARAAQMAAGKGRTHEIPLAAIPRIAKAISTSITVQAVPGTIIRTLEEVIAARRACNECFEQQGPSDVPAQASNQKHQHFIGILRETLRILKPLSKEPGQINGAKGNNTKEGMDGTEEDVDVAGLGTLFEHLEVDEPPEWTSNNLPPKSIKTFDAYELEPTDEDLSFAIFCLFKDLTDIRHYVRQTWTEYRERQIAFTTAAVTMNTAISIFRRLNEEFLSNFPRFGDHSEIIKYLYNGYHDPSHKKNDEDFATYTGLHFKISSKVFFCDLTYEMIAGFFMKGRIPFYQQEQVRGAGIRLTDDEEALCKCLSLFGLVNSQCEGNFYNDQLFQALHIAKKESTIYTWVVFAVQLFVDTRRVLGKELSRCFDETREMRKWMLATLEQCLFFGQSNKVNEFYKTGTPLLQGIKKEIEHFLEKDFVQELVDEYLGVRSALYRWGSFYLVRNHPMILGLLTQHFLTKVHEVGIAFGGDQGAIITSIHLYNASQQSGQLSGGLEWTDLEKIIEWQDPSWIFVGDRPKLPGDCLVHYNLVMGVSATILSKDRHGKSTLRLRKKTKLPISQKKNRKLRHMSTYFDLMYAIKECAKPGEPRWVFTRAAGEPLAMLEMLVGKCLESNIEKAASSSNCENKRSSIRPKVHPLRMISIFKDRLKSEEEIFRFDFLALNQRCVEMLRKSQAFCVEQSPMDYPKNEYGGDGQLNNCFSHMIAGVSGVPRSQPTRFREACLIVKEVVEAEGGIEYEKAKKRRFVQADGGKIIIDKFETPYEDNVLVYDRGHFSRIIIADDSPGFAMI